ncbi:MAG: peptide ABC transporter substrate-binding protein [Puniceicoccales bacterium]|jgi:oligopeptide transport system substrate-binding protein|nr:peptide ABC transporter substrate-binding protein [Puniceicoccales bacterium]
MLAGCKDRLSPVEKATAEGILLINNNTEPVSLDPQIVSGSIDLRVTSALFEGLLVNNPRTLDPEPGVAERWTVSDDGLVYTFHLRPNARWSDGSEVVAEDFLFSYKRVLSPRLAAPNAQMFFVVKNARAFYEGKVFNFEDTGFAAPNARTLQVTLEHPCPYFPGLVCHAAWAPVPQKSILQFGDIDTQNTPWTRPGSIIGNGPFILKTWKVANLIEVVRNPHYWNADSVKLNGIRFYAITDLLAEERAFRGNLLHLTSTVPPMKVSGMRTNRFPDLRLDPFFSTTFVRVNTRIKPLDDPRVRRALSMSIIREEIAEHVMRAGETPAYSLTPPGAAGYVCESRIDENIAEARRLLAEAGYPDGAGFPKLQYLYNTHETSQLIAQALQEMWSKNLGIRVELVSQEWKVYKYSMEKGEYQLIRSAWSGDYFDPSSFLDLFTTQSEQNQTGWSDSAYDAAIGAASREKDPAARRTFFQNAEQRLLASSPIIPLVHNRNKFLIRPEVKGWFPNELDIHPFTAVSLESVPAAQGSP